MLLEGFIEEGLLTTGEPTPEPIKEDDDKDLVMASDATLRRMGLQVIDGG